jgi:hypothetical protein
LLVHRIWNTKYVGHCCTLYCAGLVYGLFFQAASFLEAQEEGNICSFYISLSSLCS